MSHDPLADRENPYAPPQSTRTGGSSIYVFNEAFRRRAMLMVGIVLLSLAAGAPMVFMVVPERLGADALGNDWLASAFALLATYFLMREAHNYLGVLGYQGLRRRLAERLREEEIDPNDWGGVFLQLSPSDRPRVYDNFTNWDVGFLFLMNDRLVYVGDRVRFALRRSQVAELWTGDSWLERQLTPEIYLAWRDQDRQKSGALNLTLGDGRSLRQLRRATPAFVDELQAWRSGSSDVQTASPEWAQLNPPRFENVESKAIHEAFPVSNVLASVLTVGVFGFVISWAARQSWAELHAVGAWRDSAVAGGVAAAAFFLYHIPFLVYKEPRG